ncbi:two-component system response regulator [Roseofilum casamattae]|uniref:EAL domain-containing protein n=1 Tax=Roseofilum casamattae BLCC-M143 TaxID=3022442 RepID=A0ABT7BYD6_9CYAN|nr:GGDEF domain-containing response regulator [Roseofilum casamattae]MDJ1183802.1 EAL domain-containing protein [Roseofilum casamattae BLCC-M143]
MSDHFNKIAEKRNILLVDDTPENLRLLSDLLSQQGYKVRSVMNGKTAIKAAIAKPPDLILLDINMPNMNGYEVCQELKKIPETQEIPVIFISALNEVFDKVKSFRVGGCDYIPKPFQLEEVLARVNHQLNLKAARLELRDLNAQLENRVRQRTQELELMNSQLTEEIQERKRVQQKLLDMALHDSLTGLPNRALFMERLELAIERVKADSSLQFAVLFLDCDRFKVINDSLGHLVGDQLLQAIARRLQSLVQDKMTIARLGGDEFTLLVESCSSLSQAIQLAKDILERLSHSFQLERNEVFINASIGIVLSQPHYNKPEYILRDADTAMYAAKAMGKGQYHVFNPTMHNLAVERLILENDLRRAIRNEEFLVHYQPIINLETGRISGFEALVRWRHPERGLISPAEFIPMSEETGLINEIGRWVFQQACLQLKAWHQELGDRSLKVSINLSVRQFSQANLLENVTDTIQSYQLSPECLTMEITESALIENPARARSLLHSIRQENIQISLDDFGTGYSSLSYLHTLPIDILKIDRSFISDVTEEGTRPSLIQPIIQIGQILGMKVLAEGIETPGQLQILRQLNCNFGQGFFFAKALSPPEATVLLQANPQW